MFKVCDMWYNFPVFWAFVLHTKKKQKCIGKIKREKWYTFGGLLLPREWDDSDFGWLTVFNGVNHSFKGSIN